jgi:TetR/AcrR family transcriptional regulator
LATMGTAMNDSSHASRASTRSAATDDSRKGQIRQVNEAAILRAAEQVFARKGFDGATMAEIAEGAALPKANLHYYFGSKKDLYQAVLDGVLNDWLSPTDVITADADPREALTQYVKAKMKLTRERTDASKVFANEMLHGAPVAGKSLRGALKTLVQRKAAVIDGWVAAGRMAPVDSTHLFFTIWAATQTYADFDVQVRAVLGRPHLSAADHARAEAHVLSMVLRGCGLG